MARRFTGFSVLSGTARTLAVCATGVLICGLAASGQQRSTARAVPIVKEWPTYGHDSGGMRYSPLTQITPANVNQLKIAWVYHMKPPASAAAAPAAAPPADAPVAGRGRGRGGTGYSETETTPLVVGGMMYISTP